MPLPPSLEALWSDLESVRALLLQEVEGLSQTQADWRPSEKDWSVGEIINHLTLAEVATGKLTSKLLKEAGSRAMPFPADLRQLVPLAPMPAGPAEAPPGVRPGGGHPVGQLLADIKAAHERTRQTIERLAMVDPRPLRWTHPLLGEMDISQWWQLQARHEADHLQQVRAVKASTGFPR